MSDKIKTAIRSINENRLDVMKDNFRSAISEKAITQLQEKKIEIAKTLVVKK